MVFKKFWSIWFLNEQVCSYGFYKFGFNFFFIIFKKIYEEYIFYSDSPKKDSLQ